MTYPYSPGTIDSMSDLLEKESQAFDALKGLIDEARRVRDLFVRAGMSTPEPLVRLFGEASSSGNGKTQPTLSLRIPVPEKRPPDAQTDWIWVPVKDISPTTLLLGVLRDQAGFVSSKQAIETMSTYKKGLNPGSVFNIIARLSGGVIEKSDDGLRIANPSLAPSIYEGYVWGPESVFGKYELAAHRRLLIRHLLEANQSGLQIMQIVDQLTQSGLCRAPVSKDLVKVDMVAMQKEGTVRHRGNSKKWELTEQARG